MEVSAQFCALASLPLMLNSHSEHDDEGKKLFPAAARNQAPVVWPDELKLQFN
jgi:hypothetical protein